MRNFSEMSFNHSDDFCGSRIWNFDVIWHTESSDFTRCFQQTVLWVPCTFLWLFLCLEIYEIKKNINRNIPFGFLNVSKFLLTCLLVILSIVDLFAAIVLIDDRKVNPVDYYTAAIKIATFVLSAVILKVNRKFGIRTSGLQFLFWFFLLICGIPQLRSQINQRLIRQTDGIGESYDEYCFASYLIFYIASLAIWILNCYADREPLQTKYPKSKRPYPEQDASFLSRIFLAWFDPLTWKGYKKPLKPSLDLWDLNPEDSAKEITPKFMKYWKNSVGKATENDPKKPITDNATYTQTETSANVTITLKKNKKKASILPALCKAFGPTFLIGSIFKIAQDLLLFVSPQILRLLINFVTPQDVVDLSNSNASINSVLVLSEEPTWADPIWKGIFYAVLLFIVANMQTLFATHYSKRMCLVGLRIRTALINMIYKKALCLSNDAKRDASAGEIVTMVSVDVQRFVILAPYINMIWSAPFQIVLALYFLWDLLGPSVLAGMTVMIILIPVNAFIAMKMEKFQIRQMKYKDERVKLMNEILNGIKVLKLYAWEPSFEKQVLKIRENEIKVLREVAYFSAGTSFVWSCAPFLVSLVTFFTYCYSSDENILTTEKAFVGLALFDIIRMPLALLPQLIVFMVETNVSVKRINKFMNSNELDAENVSHDSSTEIPVSIENGTFAWQDCKPVLKNINLKVKKANLAAIVGMVGSGKSSIISALLGEMDKLTGCVNISGKIAYVSQQPWIQNATLQDNILFGKPMERKRYNQVIFACALKPDLEMFPAGDGTEIGEKGINLSGGQKQRVSLARAVYSDVEIYFLDDPLSAVDSHVGKHIFENVIGPNGILATKTRLLVTHSVTFLSNVDDIFVVNSGEITESGTLQELISKKGAFAEFLIQHTQEPLYSGDVTSPKRNSFSEDGLENENKTDKLIEIEKLEVGSVKWDVYKYYMKSIGVLLIILSIIWNVIYQSCSVGSSIWLAKWSNDKNSVNDNSSRDMYLGVYAAFGLAQVVFSFAISINLSFGLIRSAKAMQEDLLKNVLRWSMESFETKPLGRILNRFSKDIDALDKTLPILLKSWLMILLTALSSLFIITFTIIQFLYVIVVIIIVYYFVQRFYVATSRQLKRFESISRSPIYSHVGESIQGASTIRAYNVAERFALESDNKVDSNQMFYGSLIISDLWLALRMEMVGNIIILFAALFAVLNRNTMDAGIVGLGVSYALQITQTLNLLVRLTSEVETNIVAVERVKEYADAKQEAVWEIPNENIPIDWPKNGVIQFKNFDVRYREGLDLVLRNLTLTIQAGSKIGVVGRTGAGKSSLALALFRIIEAAGGSITIDGLDISTLGLHTLRSKLTIIPQDPVMFSGNLRMNLDPLQQKSDDELWCALELAHLKSFVDGLIAGLNHEIAEGGENLSVGQRQLICLARALLKNTKVLILDEVTAAVDLETDDLIQKTIRSEFKDCTILTIAHRLKTILNSDKVIVLDQGHVLEFDAPNNLLANENSAFHRMAKDAGLVADDN